MGGAPAWPGYALCINSLVLKETRDPVLISCLPSLSGKVYLAHLNHPHHIPHASSHPTRHTPECQLSQRPTSISQRMSRDREEAELKQNPLTRGQTRSPEPDNIWLVGG